MHAYIPTYIDTFMHGCIHRHVQVDSETDCNQCGGTPCPVQISKYQAMQLACTIFVHDLIGSLMDLQQIWGAGFLGGELVQTISRLHGLAGIRAEQVTVVSGVACRSASLTALHTADVGHA